jgi:hypothetical protein
MLTSDIRKLLRLQLAVIALFIFFKVLRSKINILNQPDFIQVFLFSFPNFCEAVVGVLTLTAIGLVFNHRYLKINEQLIYYSAVMLSGIYVISQEFKIHNLGGHNIYDPNDVIFSVVGLVVGYIIVILFKPSIHSQGN